MAEWRPFGASNDEHTCLWCGKKLRANFEPPVKHQPGESWGDFHAREKEAKGQRGPLKGYGDYLDGFFCGLRCGYQFGVRLAELDRRLSPKER